MRKLLFVLLLTLTLSVPAYAGDCAGSHDVLIRDTSSVHATHDRQQPLTSTYLDTASTRLIDARRGFRPYHTVYRDGRCLHPRPVRRSIGILRPDRPGRAYQPRAPRTGVTAFYGNARLADERKASPQAAAPPAEPLIVVIHDERGPDAQPEAEQAQPEVMEVTIYEGEAELPEHSGAVIVRGDGTVISVGD